MIKIQRAGPQIFSVWFHDHIDMALVLHPIVDTYESPHDILRLPDLPRRDRLEWTIRKNPDWRFDYAETDGAYNLTSLVFEDVIEAAWPNYTDRDLIAAGIIAAIRRQQPDGFFYVIACSVGTDPTGDSYRHEFAHALYSTNPQYQLAMQRLLADLPEEVVSGLATTLVDLGYAPDVLEDEMQAYLATGLLEEMEHAEPFRAPIIAKFQEFFAETHYLED